MQNLHLIELLAEAFRAMCTIINAWQLDGTGCDGVRFPVHSGWNNRDINMAGMLIVSKSV